jgi:polysaccharide export outer membrane protein
MIRCSAILTVATLIAITVPSSLHADAQQTVTKPILSAAPTQAPAAAAPATTIAPSATVPVTAGSAASSSSYIISQDDNISVTVWKEPSLSGSFPVRPDGMISLSLIGDIPAAGLTPMKLGASITEKLKKYVDDPNVTVTVLAVGVKQVFMLGEVGHVGAVPITVNMTPLQAIAAAGGLTPYANAKKVYILRTVDGKQTKIPFNYKKALKDGNEQGVSLIPGDTIVVP